MRTHKYDELTDKHAINLIKSKKISYEAFSVISYNVCNILQSRKQREGEIR